MDPVPPSSLKTTVNKDTAGVHVESTFCPCFSTRPADSSVSGELMFQDWFDWMVEKFNPAEPQPMNRSVSEDEWFDWLVEESKPPEPQQMDGCGMDEASTVLPGVCPPPHNLQASSPGTSVQPGLILTPGFFMSLHTEKLRQTDDANNSTTMSSVSHGSRLSLDKRSPAGCTSEKHKTISDSLCPKNDAKTTQQISVPGVLDFDLETADDDELAALFTVKDGETGVSEDASDSADTRSAQSSQKSLNPPPPCFECPSTSRVAGSTQDPPALRVQPWKTVPPAQLKECEERRSPENTNPQAEHTIQRQMRHFRELLSKYKGSTRSNK